MGRCQSSIERWWLEFSELLPFSLLGSLTDPGLARHHGEETYLRIPFACQLG